MPGEMLQDAGPTLPEEFQGLSLECIDRFYKEMEQWMTFL